jgi:DNA mismatch repair protein MutL
VTAFATRTIRVLPPAVAARIAAGEVVERPYSVVRELLDNAIDAGAKRISVEIEGGGIDLIRVVDDGSGIAPEELEVAFERHATSKISGVEDLGSVATLGFRGEALPSIAAAADVEVVSRAEGEPVGVQLLLVGGVPVRRQAKPAPRGTSFTVRGLFARHPARRKFLGTPPAEVRQVSTLVSHYALAYPGIAFQFSSGGRRLLTTTGSGDGRHAFGSVYGADTAARMLEIGHAEDGVEVRGLAGPPSLHRGNRAAISIFVNGRWVQSRPLVFAVVEGYQPQMPVGRHPMAAIEVVVAPEDVDVNVHPAKATVRFRDERAVCRVVRHAVRAALDASPVVGWRPAQIPGLPSRNEAETGQTLSAVLTPPALRPPAPLQPAFELGTARAEMTGATHRETLPLLHVVGQMAATYIVAEGPGGMYLIDQHAAHERVRFEQVLTARAEPAGVATQPLLEPVLLDLEPAGAATLDAELGRLTALGFDIEPFGEAAYLVRAIPGGLAGRDLAHELREFLDALAAERRIDDPFERAAATVACHTSVRAGVALSTEEMRQLVRDLETTEAPRTCPHGRPTLVYMSADALDRQFGRR